MARNSITSFGPTDEGEPIRLPSWTDAKIATEWGIRMRDCAVLCNKAGEHVATIGFNEAFGLWQIVVVKREEMEFFCPSKELAFAAWHDEFDPETGFPKSASASGFDA